ncbi:hypothetical protein G9A89_005033 [Geosiphon pyriformis]|nr:hypothetical protein G9A89_005033 [Geosiphon pyriformis]
MFTEIAIYLLTFLLFFTIYLVVKYPDRAVGTASRPDLKGPKGYPIIGNLLLVRNRGQIHDIIYELNEKYGPNFTLTIPGGRLIFFNTPEGVEHILKTNHLNYSKPSRMIMNFKDVFGDGIFNVDGPYWKFQRKVTSQLFQARNFRDIICVVFEQETRNALKILSQVAACGKIIDIKSFFYRFTMDTFVKICFSEELETLNEPEIPNVFAAAFDYAQSALDFRGIHYFWPLTEKLTKHGRKFRVARDILDDFSYQFIKKRRINPDATIKSTDLLNLFMNTEFENGEALTDKELRDILLNLMIAGRDTTAQSLAWMLYNIIIHPNIEVSLSKEIDNMLSSKDSLATFDTINTFKYTNATWLETLRLHPPVPRNAKECLKDDLLPGGIPIYVGDIAGWSSYTMGRDKSIWGPEATEFKPERFLEHEDVLRPSPFKFPAFNAGPRMWLVYVHTINKNFVVSINFLVQFSLGQQFATVEALILITAMMKSFRFELVPSEEPVTYGASITLPMKNPLFPAYLRSCGWYLHIRFQKGKIYTSLKRSEIRTSHKMEQITSRYNGPQGGLDSSSHWKITMEKESLAHRDRPSASVAFFTAPSSKHSQVNQSFALDIRDASRIHDVTKMYHFTISKDTKKLLTRRSALSINQK